MAASKPFRENWQTSIPFLKGIVDWMNAIGHVLNNISMTAGTPSKVMATKDGIKFVLPIGGADGITDSGGSWGFKIIAYPHVEEDESESGSGESSPRELPPPFSNLIRDAQEDESESDDDPGLFDVSVLGGPAQVLGGAEHLFEDTEFEDPIPGGTHIFVRYRITNAEGEAVCKWDDEGFQLWNPEIDGEAHSPFDSDYVEGRTLVFEIGVVGKHYENYVRQDRAGSILAVATINSSAAFVNPDYEEL